MRIENAATALAVFFSCAVLASAEPSIQLEFRDGRVWLVASDTPVREILREWARLGGAMIVNGETVEGAPVTLELAGVPERQALEVILRDVAGYVLTARAVGSAGSATFDRILIVPTTTSPPPPAPALAARRPTSAGQPNNGLPEPLASLLGSGLTGVADVHPADPDGVERDAELPEALADMLRSVTNAAMPETAPRPSPSLRSDPD